jgi:hypothetical protein
LQFPSALWSHRNLNEQIDAQQEPVRFKLIAYWIALLVVCIPAVPAVTRYFQLRKVVARKLFHFIAAAVMLPGILIDAQFTSLAAAVGSGALIATEAVRCLKLPASIAVYIDQYYSEFVDQRYEHCMLTCTRLLSMHVLCSMQAAYDIP